ncbi:hypothetical protein P5673_011568, partial [Acropora cervicornis]
MNFLASLGDWEALMNLSLDGRRLGEHQNTESLLQFWWDLVKESTKASNSKGTDGNRFIDGKYLKPFRQMYNAIGIDWDSLNKDYFLSQHNTE